MKQTFAHSILTHLRSTLAATLLAVALFATSARAAEPNASNPPLTLEVAEKALLDAAHSGGMSARDASAVPYGLLGLQSKNYAVRVNAASALRGAKHATSEVQTKVVNAIADRLRDANEVARVKSSCANALSGLPQLRPNCPSSSRKSKNQATSRKTPSEPSCQVEPLR